MTSGFSRSLPSDQQMMAFLLGQTKCRGTYRPQLLLWCHLVCHLMGGSSYALKSFSFVLHPSMGGVYPFYLTSLLFSKILVLTSMKDAANG